MASVVEVAHYFFGVVVVIVMKAEFCNLGDVVGVFIGKGAVAVVVEKVNGVSYALYAVDTADWDSYCHFILTKK